MYGGGRGGTLNSVPLWARVLWKEEGLWGDLVLSQGGGLGEIMRISHCLWYYGAGKEEVLILT